MSESVGSNLLTHTAHIVSAWVGNNQVDNPTGVIRVVHKALYELGTESTSDARQPVVPIKKSVFPDYIICLEDGRRLKMLKRHLATAFNMTPEQYREKWGLGRDYPMTAPNYAEKRSLLAKQIGLGKSENRNGGRATKSTRKG